MTTRAHADVLTIRGLTVSCIVGVYPKERATPQPIEIDVDMELDTEAAGVGESISNTVDYHAMSVQLAFVLESARFELLESAAQALALYVLAPPAPAERRAQVERVRVTLRKPLALGGAAVPSLTIERARAWAAAYEVEEKPFGTVDILYQTPKVGLYRLNLAPRASIPLHRHEVMREVEMVITDGLACQGEPVRPGTVFRWPRGAAHRYDNLTDRVQTVLCVDSPRFIEADEILTEGSPTDVRGDVSRVWTP